MFLEVYTNKDFMREITSSPWKSAGEYIQGENRLSRHRIFLFFKSLPLNCGIRLLWQQEVGLRCRAVATAAKRDQYIAASNENIVRRMQVEISGNKWVVTLPLKKNVSVRWFVGTWEESASFPVINWGRRGKGSCLVKHKYYFIKTKWAEGAHAQLVSDPCLFFYRFV